MSSFPQNTYRGFHDVPGFEDVDTMSRGMNFRDYPPAGSKKNCSGCQYQEVALPLLLGLFEG